MNTEIEKSSQEIQIYISHSISIFLDASQGSTKRQALAYHSFIQIKIDIPSASGKDF